MRSIIDYFIKNEIAGNILMILLFVVGLFGLNQMKTTFFPEIESRVISIQAIYPGSSPEEVEEGIVSKIEENLKGLTGVERVTSVSSENSANLSVEVLKGFNTDIILQDVKNAIDRISSFPVDMEPLVIYKRENLGFAINFAISGNVPLKTLKMIARQAEDDIRALEDVSKVELSGFPDEEIEITFREEDLRANNITFAEAAARIRATNLEVTGGTIKTDSEELLIRANNKKYTAAALQDIVVKSNPDGGVIRLYELADVQDRWADRPQRTFVDDQPAVVVSVQNTLEEDMLDVTDKVKDYLENTFSQKFPEVTATILLDGSITLRQRIGLLTNNGITGFFIVLLLLAMFLHYRLAFWVALAIPISFAGMFLVASILGVTINVISLFGMIIVIGILVDDGIVIAENIYQHYEDGEPAFKAALNGTMEVLPAVFAAIVTTVIAFSTFFFIDGTLGDFFREMSIVVIFSLVFSLVEGALILPAHIAHSKALSKDRKPNAIQRFLDGMMVFLKNRLYGPVLRWAVKYNWPTLAICFAGLFLVIGGLMGGFIKSTFFPVLPREDFTVSIKLPSGTREDITLDILNRIEEATWEVNQELADEFFEGKQDPVEKIQKSIGPASFEGRLNVSLLEGETRGDVTARVIIGKIRDKVGPLPEAETFTFGGGSPFGKPLSLSLLGDDGEQLAAAVDAVKESLKKIPDLKDIVDNNQEGLKEIEVELKPKAYNLGLTLNDVIGQVRQGFFGAEAQRIQRGEDEVRIWVRYGQEDRSDISDLADMRIRTNNGQTIPLSDIATFNTERGVININRIEGAREVRIEGDVSNDEVSISDVTSDVRNVILPDVLKDFPGVVASFEGQEREQAKTAKSMQLVLPIVFLMMLFVIILTFKSISQALIVFALLPFGFIGVGVGHYIHGLPISLFSVLGVIALVGIFVNDALVFITAFNERIKAGIPHEEAVIETGRSRFRPILLTSITTIAGLAPLILEKSFQAQFLIPMAISVAYGLLFGTFVLLVLIPALLMITNRIKRTAMHLYTGEKVSREYVEPSSPGRESNFLVYLIAGLVALFVFGALVFGLFQFSSVFI